MSWSSIYVLTSAATVAAGHSSRAQVLMMALRREGQAWDGGAANLMSGVGSRFKLHSSTDSCMPSGIQYLIGTKRTNPASPRPASHDLKTRKPRHGRPGCAPAVQPRPLPLQRPLINGSLVLAAQGPLAGGP
jgi:hypothetical protein